MAWIGPIVGGLIRNVNLDKDYLHGSSPSPLVASFEINNSCNQQCSYCYISKRESRPSSKSDNKSLLPLIDRCVDLGIQFITVSGKEPLMDMDSVKYLQFLDSRRHDVDTNIRYGFNTNGLNIGRYWEALIGLKPDWITISIDGLGSYHDLKRGAGTFAVVDSNIRRLLDLPHYRGRIEVATTMSTDDELEIFQLTKYLQSIGVRIHSVTPVIHKTNDGEYHQPSSKKIIDHYIKYCQEVDDMEVYFLLMKNSMNTDMMSIYTLASGYKNLMDQDCFRIKQTRNIHILSHNATRYFRITSDGHLLRGANLFDVDYEGVSLGKPTPETLPAMLRENFSRDCTLDFYKQYFDWLN